MKTNHDGPSVSLSERKLSDKSSVWSVLIKHDGQTVEIECVDMKAAALLQGELCHSIETYTNYTEVAN